MAKKAKTNARLRVIERYGRHEFELTVSKNCRTVKEIVNLYNKGALRGDEYCFLWDDMLSICKDVAYGWYNNAALKEKPTGRHALESRSLMVRKGITEAFTITNAQDSKEES